MGMRLKKGVADRLLAESGISREELAMDFDVSLREINLVLDGTIEAGEEVSLLFIAAFGANEIYKAVDWADDEDGDI